MKRSNKKGFTIVELVIVIAVIAILAAVLIPTFASLIQKANTSADIQAVRQMNTYLAVNEVEEPKTINEVFKALENGGMTVKDYHPLVSGRFFFWDSKLNRVLYTDDQYSVIFPEDYKTATKANGWLSLSGEIREEKYDISEDKKTVTISSGEQYYAFVKANKSITTEHIVFDVDTIDLMGADVGLEYITGGTFTIKGKEGGTTITGLSQLKNNYVGTKGDNVGKNYGSGLIQVIGKNGEEIPFNVTIENITISGATIGDLETGGVGAVVGKVLCQGNRTQLTLKNVNVENTVINGKNKVGVLAGQVLNADVNVQNCNISNVTVNCSEGEAGKVIGCLTIASAVTFDRAFDTWVKDVTLNLVEGKYTRETVSLSSETTVKVGESNVTSKATTIVRQLNDKGEASGWRLFFKDAYVTALYDGCDNKITIGSDNVKKLSSSNNAYWSKTNVTIGEEGYNNFVFSNAYSGN